MEKAKTRKIKKWDEVHGEHEVEVSDNTGGCEPEEVAGASPSISRNLMRSIEDMVEQNDHHNDISVKCHPDHICSETGNTSLLHTLMNLPEFICGHSQLNSF